MRIKNFLTAVLSAAILLPVFATGASAEKNTVSIYVSQNGSNEGSGSKDTPFRTNKRAQRKRGSIRVTRAWKSLYSGF